MRSGLMPVLYMKTMAASSRRPARSRIPSEIDRVGRPARRKALKMVVLDTLKRAATCGVLMPLAYMAS